VRFGKERRQEPAGANLARDLIRGLGGGGERTALSYVDEVGVIVHLSYADVARAATRWADVLHENTVVAGERVLVLAGRDLEWRSALLGATEAGAIAVPCPGSLAADEVLRRARHCGAAVIVSAGSRPDLELEPAAPVITAEELRRDPAPPQPRSWNTHAPDTAARDVGLLLHEDGAAGLRATVHTHGSLLAQALAGQHWLGADPGRRLWCTAPEGSPESVWAMLAAWGAGAELLCVSHDLDTEQRLELLHGLPVDVLWLTPDEYRALAAAEHPSWYDLSRVRRALVHPGLEEETVAALHETFGLAVGAIFGLAETGILAAAEPGKPLRPLPDLELAVVDERGDATRPGEEGELLLLGGPAALFAGYWNAPRATATALRKNVFRTGYRARVDGSGALHALALASGLEPIEDVHIEDVDQDELLGAALPPVAPIEQEPAAKLSRQERRQRQQADELRQVAERARAELDDLEQLRRQHDERLVEEQRKLEDQRLREQEKTRRKDADRAADIARREEREAAKAEKERLREEKRAAAEQRRLAQEEERREQDRLRRAERDAARAAKAAAAAAVAAEKQAHEEREQADRERQEAARRHEDERRRAEEQARREAEERSRAEATERLEQERLGREEQERREREQAERLAAEERRRAEAEAAERARLAAEEQARRETDERRRAAAEAAAAEVARVEAERREREEADRLAAEERRRAEAEAAERARLAAEEQARREAEERRRAAAEAAAAAAARAEEERRRAEQQARQEAEERRRAEEAAAARAAAERRLAEEQARREAEALLREAEERRRREDAERDRATERERAAARQAAALETDRRRRRLTPRAPSGKGAQEPAEPNTGLLARIGQYGMSPGGPPPVESERPQRDDDDQDDARGESGRR
jgi:acyl-coenzyme A synthetase/AMP-(fatty) acid ligase